MKVKLNLDTQEKKALFLLLFNHPIGLVEYLEKKVEESVVERSSFAQLLKSLNAYAKLDVLSDIIPDEEWVKVYEEYNKRLH